MENPAKRLSLADNVTWDKERYPSLVGGMIEKYGEGPFKVVGLRLHRPEVQAVDPLVVTILLKDGRPQEFGAGEWFKKV